MIFLGLGSNLTSAYGTPLRTLQTVIQHLPQYDFTITAIASFYESEPLYGLNQPWYVNTVAGVETDLSPQAAIQALLKLEAEFGRVRTAFNTSRTIDLDIIGWHDKIIDTGDLIVPHPRMQERNFVLLPLAEIAPAWQHPITRLSLTAMIAALPSDLKIRRLENV